MDRNINLIVSAMLLALFGGIHGAVQPFKDKLKNYQELTFILNLQGLYYIILLNGYNSVFTNVLILMAAVHFNFIITYHIITYMLSGVIRSKIQLSLNALTGWFIRKPANEIQLQDFTRDNIPEVSFDYSDYREPLIGQDH